MDAVHEPETPEVSAPLAVLPAERLMHLTIGTWLSQVVAVTARLGVADALAGGPRTSEEIARDVDADAGTLVRLLRAAADCGVVIELEDGRFELTTVGELLRNDVPTSFRAWATMSGMPFTRDAWTDLYTSVKTGECAFTRLHREDWFTYPGAHPEDSAIFDAAMTSISVSMRAWVVNSYDFDRCSTVVDVGGGRGALLAAILQANHGIRGVLIDTPSVAAEARATLQRAGVADRSQVVEGDFLMGVPAGGDLYILSDILHGGDDAIATRILNTCRAAMREGSRLLIIEFVLPERPGPSLAKWADLQMLALTGGRQRTPAQFDELLSRTGFRLMVAIPAVGDRPNSYIEAIAV